MIPLIVSCKCVTRSMSRAWGWNAPGTARAHLSTVFSFHLQMATECFQRGQIHCGGCPYLVRVCPVVVMRIHVPQPTDRAQRDLQMRLKESIRQMLG